MDEERRLCYVGITRARKRLYLLRSYRRSLFGGSTSNPPSRFLQDISPRLVTARGLWHDSPVPAANAGLGRGYDPAPGFDHQSRVSYRPDSDFVLKVGDHVNHSKFGPGIVMSCTPTRQDHELTVVFEVAGVKKLLASLAPLEKIDRDVDIPADY
jgi:DNA helicase II / ATP-dependent DNA helicase PcrA